MTTAATSLQPAHITSLSPEDIAEMGFDLSQITQAELVCLARKMEDSYLEHCFWQDLEWIADLMALPRI